MSIPTLDPDVWRKTEPGTSPPRQRLRAVRLLTDAGIKVNISMAPILPGISDAPEQLATVARAAYDAGASGVWANLLHLRPDTREHFLNQVARDWPHLLSRYRELYRYDAYLPEQAKAPALSKVAELKRLYAPQARRANLIEPPPPVEQLSLLALVG